MTRPLTNVFAVRNAVPILARLLAAALFSASLAADPATDTVSRVRALGADSPAGTAPASKTARKPAKGPVIGWNAATGRMNADVPKQPLSAVLPRLAKATGWQIFVEPGTEITIATAFSDLPMREALGRLFSDVNYAVLPPTNGHPRLMVYRTAARGATKAVRADSEDRVKEELVVRLHDGARFTAEQLATNTHGKVVGKIDGLKAARLRYDDAAGADAARSALAGTEGVDLEDNYRIAVPETPSGISASPAAALSIKPAPVGTDRLVIGLVDTAVQSLGPGYDAFLLGRESLVPGEAAPSNGAGLEHGTSMFANLMRSADAAVERAGSTVNFGVLSVDVYNGAESTTSFDVALGIQKAVEGKANLINLSLSSESDSPVLHELIASYRNAGVLFFAAAGNEPVTTPTFPASYPEVLAVSAGNRQGDFAPYANRGPFIDLVLPGSGIVPYGGESWLVTGTSTSTAYASGIAGALWTPQLGSPANLEDTMRKNFGLLYGGPAKKP